MASAYYSTLFEHSADDVWRMIRDFNNYPVWVDGGGESHIEEGKSGDTVGAVRDVRYQGNRIRQRLVALSDVERAQTYEFCGAPPAPLQHYRATLQVTPVVDGNRAFVEWTATFDCAADRRESLAEFYGDAFATWLGSLRRALGRSRQRKDPT